MQLNWFRAAADRLYCSSAILSNWNQRRTSLRKRKCLFTTPRLTGAILWWIWSGSVFKQGFYFYFVGFFFTALIKEIDPYYFQEHKQKKNLQTHMNIVGHWIILSYHKVYFCTSEFISHSVFCSLLFLCICTKMFSQFKNKV